MLAPIGFLSDHMEVVYDLDTEAAALASELGLNLIRASTVGTHPEILQMIRELILERMGVLEPRSIGRFGPASDECAFDCCPAPVRRPA